MEGERIEHIDRELQEALALKALLALDQLLAAMPPDDVIAMDRIGALVRLIVQALGA